MRTNPVIFNYSLRLSQHAIERMKERRIDDNTVGAVLDHGKVYFKQGLEFCTILKKKLPSEFNQELRRKTASVVVVISPMSTEIVTCYRCNNPVKYLAKKACELQKYRA